MRPSAVLVAILAAAVGVAAFFAFNPQTSPTRTTTVREILADPDRFDDVVVSVPASPLESSQDGKTMMYRRLASKPPLLIVEFAEPYPERRPVSVTGKVKNGNPVRITGARPVH